MAVQDYSRPPNSPPPRSNSQYGPISAPPTSTPSFIPPRTPGPARSSTNPSENMRGSVSVSGHGRSNSNTQLGSQFKSHSAHGHGPADIFGGPSQYQRLDENDLPLRNPPFTSTSRPSSPKSNSHSDESNSNTRYNSSSKENVQSSSLSSHSNLAYLSSPPSASRNNSSTQTLVASASPCSACQQPMSGQFVRALGTVFHLDCFRCKVRFPLTCIVLCLPLTSIPLGL